MFVLIYREIWSPTTVKSGHPPRHIWSPSIDTSGHPPRHIWSPSIDTSGHQVSTHLVTETPANP